MRFIQIKYKNNKVFLKYEVENNNNPDEYDEFQMRCADKPLASFEKAFAALSSVVLELCEMDGEDASRYEVFGVTFSWTNDIMAATITAQKSLLNSNSPLLINTPHKAETPYSEGGDEENCLDEKHVRLLATLLEEGEKYQQGHRAQLSLFPEERAA